MTVSKLIAQLQELPQDALVHRAGGPTNNYVVEYEISVVEAREMLAASTNQKQTAVFLR